MNPDPASPAPRKGFASGLKEARKETLFSELHSLLCSGLDFSRSFELLISGEKDARLREELRRLYDGVIRGASLAEAFERNGRFSALDCGVIRIGEETGRLGESLSFLADFYRKKTGQRRMVSSAVSYPLIILCTAVVVVVFMVLVIVPMFEQVYSRMGGELPALTRWIIRVSKHFPQLLSGILLLLGGAAAALYLFRENESLRRTTASVLMRLPLVGGILRKNHQAHFCQLLYLLIGSGVPLLRGLDMLTRIITFHPYRQSLSAMGEGLNRGERFAEGMARYERLYDLKLVTLVRVGEETNRLPDMLLKQSQDLTQELEHRLKLLGSALEPLLILLVGILVAVILIAMYLPMFKLGGVMS